MAKTDQVSLVRGMVRAEVADGEALATGDMILVGVERSAAPHFQSAGGRFLAEEGKVFLPPLVREALGLEVGGEVRLVRF